MKYGYLKASEIIKLLEENSNWNDPDEEGESGYDKQYCKEVDETNYLAIAQIIYCSF